MCICLVDVLSHGLCLSLPWLCTLVPAPRNLTNKTNKNCRGQTTGGGTKVYDHGKGFHSVLQAFYMFL